MKTDLKRLLAVIVALGIILSSTAAFAAWDGYKETEPADGRYVIVDMDSYATIAASGAGATEQFIKSSRYAAWWAPDSTRIINFREGIPSDWTQYQSVQFWMYNTEVKNTKFVFLIYCRTAGYYVYTINTDWEGWKLIDINLHDIGGNGGPKLDDISHISFNASGWGSYAAKGTKLAIDDIVLKKPNEALVGTIEQHYDEDTVNGFLEFSADTVSVYDKSATVLVNGKSERLDKENIAVRTKVVDNKTMVPLEFFDNYLKTTTVKKGERHVISLNGKSVEFSAGDDNIKLNGEAAKAEVTPFESDGKIYVPAKQLAEELGIFTRKSGALSTFSHDPIDGDKEEKLEEIISYAASYYNASENDATPCDFNQLAERWREYYVGNENNNLSNEYVSARINDIAKDGLNLMQTMVKKPTVLNLWGKTDIEITNAMTLLYGKIYKMALAYGTYGSSCYKDEKLREAILYALEWGYNNLYGENEAAGKGWRSSSEYNWWDWRIGTPRNLINIILIMGSDIDTEDVEKYIAICDYFGQRVKGEGSNRLNGCYVQAGIAIITKDTARLKEARDGMDVAVWYNDDGQGMHTDGSYVYHGKHPMNGAYGAEQVEIMAPLVSVLYDTKFETTGLLSKFITEWFSIAYEPFFYNGAFMSMVNGRGVLTDDESIGAAIIKAYIAMLDLFDENERPKVCSFIKEELQRSKAFYSADPTIAELNTATEILKDDSIEPRSNYYMNKVYHDMDRAVQHSKNYSAGIAMSSSRIYNYESINNQNSKGWYIGDGMLYVYTKGKSSFNPLFWILSDPYKRPGTTVDTQERQALQIHGDYSYLSDEDFVGGASDGLHGVAAMKLDSYSKDKMDGFADTSYGVESPLHNCTLEAQKSWFTFDDEIVALGSGINAKDGFPVLTVLDNRQAKTSKALAGGGDMSAYEIAGVTASAEPQSDNPAKHAIDGSLETRWAAEGNVYIDLDLGEVKPVGYAGIAIYNGNSRIQNLEIKLSKDGKSWTTVFSGQSSGTTADIELYDLKASEARYVRVCGNETTSGTWNSFLEICVYPQGEKSSIDLDMGNYVTEDKISVNGSPVSFNPDETKQFENPEWFYTDNAGGWYFPEKQTLSVKATNNSRVFVESWLEHGVSPVNRGYSYVQLPDFSEAETEAYVKNPDVEIISNTNKLQAVREKKLGKTGMVFWESGKCEDISVSTPLIVLKDETETEVSLYISDPTQKLTSTEINISGNNLTAVEFPKEAELESTANGSAIKLSVSGSRGKTFCIKFKKSK